MGTRYYPAIIERGVEGFSVFFPDFPGCASGGDSINEAARNAEEALNGHIELMVRDGDKLPAASALDKIPHDPDVDEAARILVRAKLPGKAIRLNISLDESLIEKIDSAAEFTGMTRSGYIAAASLEKISQESMALAQKNSLSGKFCSARNVVDKKKRAKRKQSRLRKRT